MTTHRGFNRTDRIAEYMAKEIALLIQYKIKDPRIQKMISVSEVQVSRDLSHAKVYVSMLADEQEIIDAVSVLNHAAGYLRSLLAQKMSLRTTPALEFIFDKSFIEGNRMSALIDKLLEDDEQKKS